MRTHAHTHARTRRRLPNKGPRQQTLSARLHIELPGRLAPLRSMIAARAFGAAAV